MKPSSKPYFFKAFSIILLSAVIFLVIKNFLPKNFFSEDPGTIKNIVIDSLLLEAVSLKKDTVVATVPKDSIVFEEEKKSEKLISKDSDFYKEYQYLNSFYEKLFQLEEEQKGKVRIAYFGDSMTDGDLIVKDLRINFQRVFGGRGIGFVSITSESAATRTTLLHQYSKNWKTQSFLNVKRPINSFGVNGHVFFVKDTNESTWVRYKAKNIKLSRTLDKPTLFYGRSNNKEASVISSIDRRGEKQIRKLTPKHLLNTLSITSGSVKEIKSEFVHAQGIPFYGYNFDDGKGVHIDNFSKRGNSGLPISLFNKSLMRAFNDKLEYNLIILHYGTNVLNYGSLNYDWYDKKMTKVIEHLKDCFPGVSILIVSVGDKATKYGGERKTDSAVVPLINAQRRYAIKTKSEFVNLYTLMGGDGSMIKWVEEEPAKAARDYTHFNFRGAEKVAEMLYDYLNTGYQRYKVRRNDIINNTIVVPERMTIKNTDSLNFIKDTIYD